MPRKKVILGCHLCQSSVGGWDIALEFEGEPPMVLAAMVADGSSLSKQAHAHMRRIAKVYGWRVSPNATVHLGSWPFDLKG